MRVSRHLPTICALFAAAALLTGARACAAPPPAAVRIGYFANVTHAQAVLGVASGEYAKAVAPVKLETKTFNAGPALIEALFAGEIDIGYVGPSPALAAHAQSHGQGIRIIAGAAANGVVIVARADSGINTLEDLKGKRIATPQMGNTQDVSARHYLMAKLGQKDVTNVLPVPNAEQAAMMSRGQIDAAWVAEPWGARLEAEAGAKVIAQEKDLWPSKEFTLSLVVVTPKFLSEHPDVVEAVLKAHCAWTARLASEPEKQAQPLADALRDLTGKTLAKEMIASAIARVKFTDDPLEESLKTFATWSFDLGFTKQPTKLTGLVDKALLTKVKAAPGAAPATTKEPGH